MLKSTIEINRVKKFIKNTYTDIAYKLLKLGFISEVPELKYTTNKKVFGYIKVRYNSATYEVITASAIYININYFNSMELTEGLVETICHELAHTVYVIHNVKHRDYTNTLIQAVSNYTLNKEKYNKLYEYTLFKNV